MIFDGTDDFSTAANSNVNGVWSYREGQDSNTLLSTAVGGTNPGWFGSVNSPGFGNFPYIIANRSGGTLSGNWTPDLLLLHPAADGTPSVLRWTAPADGSYTVSGLFRSVQTGLTTGTVLINRSPQVSVNLSTAVGDVPFNFMVNATMGDFVEFAVGPSNDGFSADSVGLRAVVTSQAMAVPEPSSLVLVSSVAICGAIMRRRRSKLWTE